MKSKVYSQNTVLLLTACINPKGMCMTVLTDANQRLSQYLESLKFYLEAVPNRIVFVENTGYDISSFFSKEIEQGRLECLAFDGNDYDKTLGKGYGEALIIEYAMTHSELLKDASNIVKITGRVKCTNISTFVRKLREVNVVYTDFRRQKEYYDSLPSVMVSAPFVFWKLFLGKKEKINDTKGVYFEHVLKQSADEWVAKGCGHSYFPCPVYLSGISGSTGTSYAIKHNRLKWIVKSLLYRLYIKDKLFMT